MVLCMRQSHNEETDHQNDDKSENDLHTNINHCFSSASERASCSRLPSAPGTPINMVVPRRQWCAAMHLAADAASDLHTTGATGVQKSDVTACG